MAIVNGTNNSETLDAADGVTYDADEIHGWTANDTIYGLGGDDVIYGGDGNDIIRGGRGADVIYGGSDTDTVAYNDSLSGVVVRLDSGLRHRRSGRRHTLRDRKPVGSCHDDALVGNDDFATATS